LEASTRSDFYVNFDGCNASVDGVFSTEIPTRRSSETLSTVTVDSRCANWPFAGLLQPSAGAGRDASLPELDAFALAQD